MDSGAELDEPRAVWFRAACKDAGKQVDAGALAAALRTGSPSVWVLTDQQDAGVLLFELVPLTDPELDAIVHRPAELLPG